ANQGNPPPAFTWALTGRPAGSTATLDDPTFARPSFVADRPGTYQVSLVVRTVLGFSSDPVFLAITVDPCGTAPLNPIATSFVSDVDPEIGNVPLPTPPAKPTPDVGARVTVNAVATQPAANAACSGHNAVSYQWAVVGAPAGSRATLTSTTAQSPSLVPDL